MLASLILTYAWVITIVFILLLTLYLDNKNYYLGAGYCAIVGLFFLIITMWISYIS
jgi:hypothetical protein